ncbi:TonB family protein [Verrucomicrobia bacterium]|nr:TonB family protein [Verrucomicrobiota bacterium]
MGADRTLAGSNHRARLPRFCLPAPKRDPERTLAWTNSICTLILLIGIFGAKSAAMRIRPLPPVQDTSAVLVEPLPPPPSAPAAPQQQDQSDEEKSDAPQVVVVTPNAPSISFSVPTIGNLVVPNAVAVAPPSVPLKQVEPLHAQPLVISSTGAGGERPQPPYPTLALEQGQQGSVVLQLTVDDSGTVTHIEVKESSGFPVLDRSALDFVKRRWVIPPGQPGARTYEAKINYRLKLSD